LNAAVWTVRFVAIAATSGSRPCSLAGGPKSGVHYRFATSSDRHGGDGKALRMA
jgi:hypothetical protein